jgi:hypothetical protein
MALPLLCALLLAATITDAADGFLGVIGGSATAGSVVGAWIWLVLDYRRRRRSRRSPWADEERISSGRYIGLGLALGGIAGLTVAILDAYMLL